MNGRLPVVVLMALLVMLFASGCGASERLEPGQLPENEQMNHSDQGQKENGNQSAKERNNVIPNNGGSNKDGEKPKTDLEISSIDEEDSASFEETPAQNNHSPDQSADPKPFNKAHPDLLGISIGETHDTVISRFGTPASAYTMDDPVQPLSVLRYAHFAIGLDAVGKVEFIDVFSPHIDPGLNGIRIGTFADDAVEALGEPTVHTEFVMSYTFEQVVLKFDLDPATRQITSIKLFAG